MIHTERYDAVLLDLGLPGTDGLTWLRQWREQGLSVPVLVLTARGSWHEKVLGIDSGADDYVSKPFRMEEVLARLRGLIRRARGHVTPELRCGEVALDPRASRVTLNARPAAQKAGRVGDRNGSRHAPIVVHGVFAHSGAGSLVALLCLLAGLWYVRRGLSPVGQLRARRVPSRSAAARGRLERAAGSPGANRAARRR